VTSCWFQSSLIPNKVFYKNKNFRGLGEQFEFTASQKEAYEQKLQDIGTSWKLKWSDGIFGRTSKVELEAHNEALIDYAGNYDGWLAAPVEPMRRLKLTLNRARCVLTR
jgi:hypothetical protein